jgi:hypothetical protein
MWIMLSDCFLSIVSKDCQPDELVVRARRPGDIEQVFPGVKVRRDTKADYLYRAVIPRMDIALRIAERIDDINYPNFKDSVTDDALHRAYMQVWFAMVELQPLPPYSGVIKRIK